ncbi:putative BNR/Asp-box repeat protein [Aspergillus coremiiformis]|uniref:Putative BNR/Asp-box repeat protein n=1 Tax=Aspergillus coremiiformis TaxID=138285 RepID=A0A5N6ZE27_9EURO|nr:putative BNR/Asp-box repeat protein [Aspergillus coremiiformis]
MPGNFGQKIMKTFGLDEGQGQGQGHGHGQGQGERQGPRPGQPPQYESYPPPQYPQQQPFQGHPQRCPRVHEEDRYLSQNRRGTYPRIARLGDGSVLASFTHFQGDTRILTVTRSTDGGWTFEDWGEISRGEGDVDNVFLLEIAAGTVLAAFRNHDLGPNGPTHFRITVCRSTDGGRTWQFLSQAAEKDGPHGIWEPFMRLGRQGEVQLTYSLEFAQDNQCTMMVRSLDGGATWSPPQCLHGECDALRDGMNGIAPTWDHGRAALVMIFETTSFGTFNLEALISYDDGQTWGYRHRVYVPPQRHNAGAPQIASFADGSLAVIFMTDEDHPEVSWTKNASIKAIFAPPPQNGQIFWSHPQVICPHSSHWPGIAPVDGHTLLATFECDGQPRAKAITLQ